MPGVSKRRLELVYFAHEPNIEAMQAFAWIINRRRNPQYTLEDAGQLDFDELQEMVYRLLRR